MEKIILVPIWAVTGDDVGALALVCGAHKRGEAALLGVTHAIDNPYGLRFIEKMLAHYWCGRTRRNMYQKRFFER